MTTNPADTKTADGVLVTRDMIAYRKSSMFGHATANECIVVHVGKDGIVTIIEGENESEPVRASDLYSSVDAMRKAFGFESTGAQP